MSDVFDILSEESVATSALHLKNAAGELMYADSARTKPVRIHLYGPGTPQQATIEARASARATKRYGASGGKVEPLSPEERLADEAEDLATVTAEFENFTYSAAPDAKGEALFRAVYSNPKLGFINRQVNKYAADWGNFRKASPTS